MIPLFFLNDYTIPLGSFDHHLHGSVVTEFEQEFCKYVGAPYGCAISSATNAIFLLLLDKKTKISIPSMLPAVVANSVINSGNSIEFEDNTSWVGHSYTLHENIIDSAQRVDKNQYANESKKGEVMFFSFYPTKPVGGIDGGIVVSDDKELIDWIREASMNGMSYSSNSWEREQKFAGWKMYMSSSQAYVALNNLRKLDDKKKRIKEVRDQYNKAFNLTNTSEHLYRVSTGHREQALAALKEKGIVCGVHYKPLHQTRLFPSSEDLPISEAEGSTTLSIPLHEGLSDSETQYIIKCVGETL
jgi:dTDP-4-amino-4,6-dideoxygalactose transaminase